MTQQNQQTHQDKLLSHVDDGVLVLTNHNPSARNALSLELYDSVIAQLEVANQRSDIGCVIITGAGGHFCAGGDMQQLVLRRTLSLAERHGKIEALNAMIDAIKRCNKPVIAAVEGAVAGAGVAFAMACDLVIASRSSFYSLSYIKIGLTPDGGVTSLLSRGMPRQLLTEMCLSGDRVAAERLWQLGFINQLCDEGQALEQALARAKAISAGPRHATAQIKQLCHSAYDNAEHTQIRLETVAMANAQASEESKEGIAAFLEKRKAVFPR